MQNEYRMDLFSEFILRLATLVEQIGMKNNFL